MTVPIRAKRATTTAGSGDEPGSSSACTLFMMAYEMVTRPRQHALSVCMSLRWPFRIVLKHPKGGVKRFFRQCVNKSVNRSESTHIVEVRHNDSFLFDEFARYDNSQYDVNYRAGKLTLKDLKERLILELDRTDALPPSELFGLR